MFGPFYKHSQFQISFLLPQTPISLTVYLALALSLPLWRALLASSQTTSALAACASVDVLLHMRINPATNCNYHNALQHNSQLSPVRRLAFLQSGVNLMIRGPPKKVRPNCHDQVKGPAKDHGRWNAPIFGNNIIAQKYCIAIGIQLADGT